LEIQEKGLRYFLTDGHEYPAIIPDGLMVHIKTKPIFDMWCEGS
jgi:hypothetical protein